VGTYHVLLIGIDTYDGGGSLRGCVNDVAEMHGLLVQHVGIAPDRITRLTSPVADADGVPTLDNICAHLRRLADVEGEDRVLIYYSGHGTQCIVAGHDGKRYSREALLPKDKVAGPERRYLFDWQLNKLIKAISNRTPRVTIILDSCSSAGITRDVGAATMTNTATRCFPSTEVYELGDAEGPVPSLSRGIASNLGVVSQVQLIAACRDDERAREMRPDNGSSYGILTRAIVTAVKAIPPAELPKLRWGRIWRTIEREVRAASPGQNPYITGELGRHVFGFGTDEDADCGYALIQVPDGFELDVGRLHGITPGAEVAVYPELPSVFPPLGSDADARTRVGHIRVTEARASSAIASATQPFKLPAAARGRLVKAGAEARLRVRLVPHDAAIEPQIGTSDLVTVVQGDSNSDVELVKRGDVWLITDEIHGFGDNAIAPELFSIPTARTRLLRNVLEHYHAYSAPIRLARCCRDLPSNLQITLLDCTNRSVDEEEAQDPNIPLVERGLRSSYEVTSGTHVCFVVENISGESLWVTVINCAASGRVQILGEQEIAAHARRAFWSQDQLGRPWTLSLPHERSVGVDRLVAIGTTNKVASLQHLKRSASFDDILNSPGTFRSGAEFRERILIERWTSAMTTIRITAPVL